MRRLFALMVLASGAAAVSAAGFDYALASRAVADGVYVFEGRTEHFSRDNGGNIVNTGYITTDAGAVVIDTGPSRRYGEQMREVIERQTGGGIARVFLTHAHPDHFLGNQAYGNVTIGALPASIRAITVSGEDLAANLYRLVGGWMIGTEAVTPRMEVVPGEMQIGGRRLRMMALAGHTDGDLAVFDERTRTLFAGDLAFLDRTPTTPNADLGRWLMALDELERIDFAVLVPGHGPVVRDRRAIAQTRAYLRWLRDSLQKAAGQGLDLNEVMHIEVPPEFARLAVFGEEFQRSVVHLYPEVELETLRPARP